MNESIIPHSPDASRVKMIVGLGNPGDAYLGTRHNIGFRVIDQIAETLGAKSRMHRSSYYVTTVISGSKSVQLLWPTKYVNLSGDSILQAFNDFGLSSRDLLVVSDDLNIELGAIRVRTGGADGGHNGLASICEAIETQEFARLRVGIGPYADRGGRADFVLGRFEETELESVNSIVDIAAKAAIFAVHHSLEEVMIKINNNPALSGDSFI